MVVRQKKGGKRERYSREPAATPAGVVTGVSCVAAGLVASAPKKRHGSPKKYDQIPRQVTAD